MPQPRHLISPFREPLGDAHRVREVGEDREVASSLRPGLDRLTHGDEARVVRRAAQIVPLERHRRRQHDVGVASHRRPERVVDDDRLRPRERPTQAREILMVVEGIAAAPVHEADVGEGQSLAVEVEGLAGMEQHVRDAREGDEVGHGVAPLGQSRRADAQRRAADVSERAVALAEAAAGQPDLAEHRRQRHRQPRRLLAVLDALERVVDVDQGPLRGHAPGERADARRGNLGQPLGPLRRLRAAVGGAEHVGLEALESDAVTREERAVVQAFADKRVRQRQHDGDVGARHDRQPLGADEPGQVVAQRAQQHELGAALSCRAQVITRRMPGGAAGTHHRVLDRDAAEADEQLGVALEHRPRGRSVEELAHRADDARHDDRLRAVTVSVLAAHIAAQAVQKSMELALRVMEATGAAPAIGAAVDPRASAPVVDASKLVSQPVDRRRPADGHERLRAAA